MRDYLADSCKHKCDYSIILRQKEISFGTLLKGEILIKRILEYEFNDKDELYESAFSECFNRFFALESQRI